MTRLTPCDASCLFGYRNGQVSTIGKERSSETCLRIDLKETIEYAFIPRTILCGYTLTKWTRANWMSVDDNWTSCIDLAEFDRLRVFMDRVACW